jgi:uncharacterized protein
VTDEDQREDGKTPDGGAPRYRPPAPYPPPTERRPTVPAPGGPAPAAPPRAVPGYVPPAGGVWAPPAGPAGPRPPSGPAVPPALHELRPQATAAWDWRQSLWGLVLGMGPFFALYAAASSVTGDTQASVEDVTFVTALVFLLSSVISYGWQLFAAWLFSVRTVPDKLRAWGFRRPNAAFFWTVPAVLVAAYAMAFVNDALFHPPQQDIVDSFPPTAGGVVLFTVVAVVLAPLCEETYFRGFLFRGFENSWGWVLGAVLSAIVFSLAHLQLTLFLPLFTLGFGLAWAYRRSGSLWTSITVHAIFNGVAVLAWALTS